MKKITAAVLMASIIISCFAFIPAHAEEANRLLETPHLNGWTL